MVNNDVLLHFRENKLFYVKMDLGGLLEGSWDDFWRLLGCLLGGLWASWGSTWRLLGPLGRHFGGPGARLGTILELSGASWGPFL